MNLINFYRYIAQALVEFPDKVQVEYNEEETRIEVRCDPTDCGKLIGVKGQNYKACEDLLQAAAIRQGWKKRIFLEIFKEQSKPGFTKRFERNHKWGAEESGRLCELVALLAKATIADEIQIDAENRHDTTNIYIRTPGPVHERIVSSFSFIMRAIGLNRGRVIFIYFNSNEAPSRTSRA